MDGVQLSQGKNHFKEAIYFFPRATNQEKNNSILKYEKQRKGKFSNKSISLIIFLFNGILDYSDLYFCYWQYETDGLQFS